MFEIFGFGIRAERSESVDDPDTEDDRAVALICATVLEQSLERAMLCKLIPMSDDEERRLFSDDGAPLASFDAKIRMAFALGVIGKAARDDLGVIRSIRNTFAHSRLPVQFQTPEVATACSLLTVAKRKSIFRIQTDEARWHFISAAADYATYLICFDPLDPEAMQWRVLDLEPPPELKIQDLQVPPSDGPRG